MALKLNSSGGGSVTIDPVSTASNVTITIPATSGGSLVTADSSGNVGIGITSPSSLLDLNKTSGAADIRLKVGGTLYGNLYASSSDMTVGSVAAIPLIFGTTNTERMRIDGSGNVGIGTSSIGIRLQISSPLTGTTPRSNSVLRIQSEATGRDVNIQLSDNITNSAELGMVGGAMYMATAGTEKMRIDGSGNVSIGGTTTLGKLDVTGSVYASAGYVLPNDQTMFWGSGDGSTRIQGNSTTDVMSLYTVGAERIRIESTGNVGIGTAPTGFVTHTAGFISTYFAGGLYLRSGTNTSGRYWGISSENNANSVLTIYNAVGTGQYMVYGATAWTANSDERLKTGLTPFSNAIQKVSTLRAGTGRYLTDDTNVSRSFLIAQDVQQVLPEAVDVQEDELGTLGLRYTDLIPLLTAAIQEQQALIVSLTARISALENKI